jgi:curli production assembly/transport component CsgF
MDRLNLISWVISKVGEMDMGKIVFRVVCVASVVGLLTPAFATEQVYHPINPALGGNPNNGSFLLSTAQSQGQGTKSGNQGPDLSGLTNALSGLGSSSSSTVANPTTTQSKMQ